MKQITIANAYPIIMKIANCDLPYQLSWDLVQMIDKLKPIADFQLEKRRELVQKFNPEYIEETQQFQFKSADDAAEFAEKQAELDKMESDIKIEKIRISIDFLQEGKIKANDILVLRESGLIEIYKPQVIELKPEENTTDESKETEEEESK